MKKKELGQNQIDKSAIATLHELGHDDLIAQRGLTTEELEALQKKKQLEYQRSNIIQETITEETVPYTRQTQMQLNSLLTKLYNLHKTFQNAMNEKISDEMEFDSNSKDKAIDVFINDVLDISRRIPLEVVCRALLKLNPAFARALFSEGYKSESEKNNILKKLLSAQVAMNTFNNYLKPLTKEQKKVIQKITIDLVLEINNNPNFYKSLSDDCIRAQINLQPTEIQDIHSYINEKNSKALEDKINEIIKKLELENLEKPEPIAKEKIQDAYNQTFTTQDPLQAFGSKLFQDQWHDIQKNQNDKKFVERGFKVLQKAYPDGKIDDKFRKVEENQCFIDFLKVCAIVLTLGLAALSERTTLQSTKQKNLRRFTEHVTKQQSDTAKSQPR